MTFIKLVRFLESPKEGKLITFIIVLHFRTCINQKSTLRSKGGEVIYITKSSIKNKYSQKKEVLIHFLIIYLDWMVCKFQLSIHQIDSNKFIYNESFLVFIMLSSRLGSHMLVTFHNFMGKFNMVCNCHTFNLPDS